MSLLTAAKAKDLTLDNQGKIVRETIKYLLKKIKAAAADGKGHIHYDFNIFSEYYTSDDRDDVISILEQLGYTICKIGSKDSVNIVWHTEDY